MNKIVNAQPPYSWAYGVPSCLGLWIWGGPNENDSPRYFTTKLLSHQDEPNSREYNRVGWWLFTGIVEEMLLPTKLKSFVSEENPTGSVELEINKKKGKENVAD